MTVQFAPKADLYVDYADEHEGHWFIRPRTVVSRQTKHQKVEILEFSGFGKALVLDGALQSTQSDEHIYHEGLIQPALCLHPDPRRVLIIGGGEGASAREVLKHRTVERLVMVDLDGEVVDLCRQHLPSWHQGAFDDPRLECITGDGQAYILDSVELFDVIVIDVVDAFDGGPAEELYSEEFYRAARTRLAPRGVLVIQGMECNVNSWRDHRLILDNLASVFKCVRSSMVYVPSFWSTWGFIIASDDVDPLDVSPEAIDHEIERRGLTKRLGFYDGRAHVGMFSLGKDLRRLLFGKR